MQVSDVIGKIDALFKQAANTSFPEEAATFQAKAQELMTKYQIEMAMLNDRVLDDELTHAVVHINNPYMLDKSILLNSIAKHNYCKVIRYRDYCKVFGYKSDIQMVTAMFTALELHMISEMWKNYIVPDHVSAVSWKKSFFAGYASKISSRLAKAKRESVADANKTNGNDSVSLVLLKKDELVQQYYDDNSGATRSTTRTVTSMSGYGAGTSAGGRANIGQSAVSGSRALGR